MISYNICFSLCGILSVHLVAAMSSFSTTWEERELPYTWGFLIFRLHGSLVWDGTCLFEHGGKTPVLIIFILEISFYPHVDSPKFVQ